jgi:uncharacterized repeat protein (TIGR02543 family)
VTLIAIANPGYVFSSWTESGNVVSTSLSYTFAAAADRTLVANFSNSPVFYNVSVMASPAKGGNVSGSGTSPAGSTLTVHAAPRNGYVFSGWFESGNLVSTSPDYTFTLTNNRFLVAQFNRHRARVRRGRVEKAGEISADAQRDEDKDDLSDPPADDSTEVESRN